MKNKILLGFDAKKGQRVEIETSHLIVTGLSQKAGKTTCLESMIKRSGKRAVVFRTKIGEKSFLSGTIIPPYFKDKSDWQFIEGLVEATIKEKMRSWERAKIIQLCKQTGGNSLIDFKKKVDARLIEPKLNNFEKDILTNLQAYLELVLPKLQSINFSNRLEIVEGLNIIDLERFSRDVEVQSLIIRSTIEEILYNFKDVIVVIPEFWKFSPQDRGNPCKSIIEEFVRQGATNGNYIWIDSQDMTGVDKQPLKQVSEWILGYQSEENEVKKTLAQIPLPKNTKPKAEDIMQLGTGFFYLATRERTVKVYVLPFWLDEERGRKVAIGELKISDLDMPETITPFKIAVKQENTNQQPIIDFQETSKRFNKELSEMGTDFFNKIADIQEQINKLYSEIFNIKNQPKENLDEDIIIRKLLQKIPVTQVTSQSNNYVTDKESIIKEVLLKIPKSTGNIVYEVAPLEKIKKDFLEEAKNKILNDISQLDERQKKILKFVEQKGSNSTKTLVFENCFGKSSTSGPTYQNLVKKVTEMKQLEIIKIDTAQKIHPYLKDRIINLISQYEATPEEINNLYSHILIDLLK